METGLHNFMESSPIAWGGDSCVFRSGENVIKVYKTKDGCAIVPFSQLDFYRRVTNQVAAQEFCFPGTDLTIPLEVNPIDKIADSEIHGCPVSVSRFVPGCTLSQLCSNKFCDFDYRIHPELNPIRQELASRGFCEVNKINCTLACLDARLNRELGVTGIKLFGFNVKVVFDKENPSITSAKLVVTDLCASVKSLKRV